MEKCIYCGKETILYYAGKPICIKCSGSTERKPCDSPKPPEEQKRSAN